MMRAPLVKASDLALPQEKHLRNLRQLTFGVNTGGLTFD